MSNVLKVVSIDLASAGDIDADGKYDSIVQKDSARYVYKKLVIKDSSLAGCILYGDIAGYRKITRAIDEKRSIKGIGFKVSRDQGKDMSYYIILDAQPPPNNS